MLSEQEKVASQLVNWRRDTVDARGTLGRLEYLVETRRMWKQRMKVRVTPRIPQEKVG